MRSLNVGLLVGLVFLTVQPVQPGFAQTRDEKVRSDRDTIMEDETWHYDDLEAGFAAANREGKPLMAVLRCIP